MTINFETRDRLSLNGEWELSFPSEPESFSPDWLERAARASTEGKAAIRVPGIWNLSYPDRTGAGYYRKVFEIPAGWTGGALQVKFAGSSYRTEAWLNRTYLGSHEGAYTPFSFDITGAALPGQENELVVRVAALSKTERVDGMLLKHCPASKQSWHYTFGGLWGEVCVERCAQVACESAHATPDLMRELVEVEISLNNHSDLSRPVDLTFQIFAPSGGKIHAHAEEAWAHPGQTRFYYTVRIPRPEAWRCEEPNLYSLQVQVHEETGEMDRACVKFGMRDFTVRNGSFFLNGEALFVRGILLQPNYPANLVAPEDPELLTREILLAKEAGFNLIRVHISPPVPGFLDLADELGMLVYEETSLAWIRESPRMLDHGRRELREMIERDRTHPSVVFWGIYNENPPAAELNGEILAQYARSLDPTRVIVINSGGSLAIDQNFGWLDRAMVIPNRSYAFEPIQDVHVYLGGLVPDPTYDWLRDVGTGISAKVLLGVGVGSEAVMEEFDRESRSYSGQIFVSELGYGGMTDLDKTVAGFGDRTHLQDASELRAFQTSLREGFAERCLERVFGPISNFYALAQELQALADTRQIEALLCNPRVSGYVLSQLNDVSWECHAGLLDVWRNPKPAYYAVQRLNQPGCLILRALQPAVWKGENIQVQTSLVSRQDFDGLGQLDLTVIGPQDEIIAEITRVVQIRRGIQGLEEISIPTGGVVGRLRVEGVLSCAGEVIGRSTQKVLVLTPANSEDSTGEVSIWGDLSGPLVEQNSGAHRISPQPAGQVCLAARPGSLLAADWTALLDATAGGSTTILGEFCPTDQLALQCLAERGIQLRVHATIGSWMGCYHWISDSAVFSGLPTRLLADEAYRTVVPRYSLGELGGRVIAGALRNTSSLDAPSGMLWYSDVEVLPFGSGRIIFCQYRVFDRYTTDPVAAQVVSNLLGNAQQIC